MLARTGVSDPGTLLPSRASSRYQHRQLRLGVKLPSDSSFSSGLFSCGQARVNATVSPSPGCTASLSQCSALYARVGALRSMSSFSAALSAASFICYQKDRETNCVTVPTYSLGFIPEREINDSASSWSVYIKTQGVKSDILCVCVCVCVRACVCVVQHCHSSSLSKSTIIWSPPGGKCAPLISLE